MIVPRFWAEGRIQERVAGQQVTVRRFGWSDDSPLAAQAHADQRTREAYDRIVSGETLERRERKLAYNGAHGVPIREEILERQGDSIVTRNSYGARCLNTPDVLFVDVDFESEEGGSRRSARECPGAWASASTCGRARASGPCRPTRPAARARRLGRALRKGGRGICRLPVPCERGQHVEGAPERLAGAGTARRTHPCEQRFAIGLRARAPSPR